MQAIYVQENKKKNLQLYTKRYQHLGAKGFIDKSFV